MAQIQKGDTFVDGQQVTGARLNQLIDSATILPNLITDQTSLATKTVASDDSVLVYDTSATALRKTTVSDVLSSNNAIITSSISGGTNSDITITPNDGTIVTGATYTSSDGLNVVVTSTGHSILVNTFVTISGAGTGYNGTFIVTSVTTNTFTYTMSSAATAGSGTLSYTKKGTIRNTANKSISSNLYVGGGAAVGGNLVVSGSTIQTGSVTQNNSVTQNGSVTMNGVVNITTAPTTINNPITKSYFDSFSSNYGAKTGDCFAIDSSTLYKTTNEFTIPSDETWVFEFHCHWMYPQGGNTRPDNYFYISATLEKTGTTDVVLFTDAACSTAYGAQARAFSLVILNNTLMGGTSKKLKFTTSNTNVDTSRCQYMITVRKLKTADFNNNSSILS